MLESVRCGRWFRLCFLAVLVTAGGCGGGKESEKADETRAEKPAEERADGVGEAVDWRGATLDFRLSTETAGKTKTSKSAETADETPTEALDDAARDALLEDLPALEADEVSEETTGPPRVSLGRPDSGRPNPESIRKAALGDPSKAQTGGSSSSDHLEVVRRHPEGDVDRASRLSVTFSEPMVPVGEVRELGDRDVPVELSPDVPGTWRWIGTRTLVFEPEDGRFPMATEYTAKLTETVESAAGARPEESVAWKFRTAPVRPVRVAPTGGPHAFDPLMFVEFNQRVSRRDIIDYIDVWGGGETYTPRPVDPKEVRDHPEIGRLAERAPEGHWIAFRVGRRLAAETTHQIGLRAGAPSEEGPLRTQDGDFETFSTYGRFEIEAVRCGWKGRCPPESDWVLIFNHAVDPDSVGPQAIQIEPSLEEVDYEVRGRRVIVDGRVRPNTKYEVRAGGKLRDRFGQNLRRPTASTLEVSEATPRLWTRSERMALLDPTAAPRAAVSTVGADEFDVTLHAVEPDQWSAFVEARRRWLQGEATDWPGTEVASRQVDVLDSPKRAVATTQVDLAEALEGDHGHLVMTARLPEERGEVASASGASDRAAVWYQATDIGLDAFVDRQSAVVWTTSLTDAEPLEDATVRFAGTSTGGETDASGVTRLKLPSGEDVDWGRNGGQLVVERGDDTAFLPEFPSGEGKSDWLAPETAETVRWYVVGDRDLYRPGETMHLRGWLRRVELAEGAPSLSHPDEDAKIAYRVEGPRDETVAEGTAERAPGGGFHAAIELPDEMDLGPATVEWRLVDAETSATHTQQLAVREFRRPTFEVGAESGPGPHVVGATIPVDLEAGYYAGGALSGADVAWEVEAESADWSPPGRSNFTFGQWQPPWSAPPEREPVVKRLEGRTQPDGTHRLAVETESIAPPGPVQVTAEATVRDVDRRTVSSRESFFVHPAGTYVGLRTDAHTYASDETIEVEAIATNVAGEPVAGRGLTVAAEQLQWKRRGGERRQVVVDRTECEKTAAEEPVACQFESSAGGTYRIVAEVRDESGRLSRSSTRVWVAGRASGPKIGVEDRDAELIPASQDYRPGETAEILVRSPVVPARGLVTVRSSGETRVKSFRLEESSKLVGIPIEPRDVPKARVQATLVGNEPRPRSGVGNADAGHADAGQRDADAASGPTTPAQATGNVELDVSRANRRLDVEVEETRAEPGAEATVDVEVTRPDGSPAEGAVVAAAVVDESVLAASDWAFSDPLEVFFPESSLPGGTYHLREHVLLGRLDRLLELPEGNRRAPDPMRTRRMAAEKGAETVERQETRTVRTEGAPLAHFESGLALDDQGEATLEFDVPEQLTHYRVMVATSEGDERFGHGAGRLTVRKPVALQVTEPRFANVDDQFGLSVLVHNRTDDSRRVDLAGRARGLKWRESSGWQFAVPGGGRSHLNLPVEPTSEGMARVQFALKSGEFSDAHELAFPVGASAQQQSFAEYGTIAGETDSQATIPLRIPAAEESDSGEVRVTASATAVGGLSDALEAVVEPASSATEPVASALLAVAEAKEAERLSLSRVDGDKSADEMAAAHVERLERRQNPDGGFGNWSAGGTSMPRVSVHTLHALHRADEAGLDVADETLEGGESYLRDIENQIPAGWSEETKSSTHAHALWVLQRAGTPEPGEVRTLVDRGIGEKLSVEAAGWLLSAMAASGSGGERRDRLVEALRGRLVAESGKSRLRESTGDDNRHAFASAARAEAVVLEALVRAGVDRETTAPLARGLLARRSSRGWRTPQETALALGALRRFTAALETSEPDLTWRAWIGDRRLGERRVESNRAAPEGWRISVDDLRETFGGGETVPVTVQKEGDGPLYYGVDLTYARERTDTTPWERGFAVERTYEAVDDPTDVQRRPDGTWIVEAGARVRTTIRVAVTSDRNHVAVVDRPPAGFEPSHPELATSRSKARETSYRGWFDHQNVRGDRVEVFADQLDAGVYRYRWVARATIPGEYHVSPARAEEMYHPETSGGTTSAHLIVR